MKRLLREPLVHFLLLGALIFGVYSWMHSNARGGDSSLQVHITAAEVAWLKETWTRQWQREPTHDEMRSIVADYLREELLAREARSMVQSPERTWMGSTRVSRILWCPRGNAVSPNRRGAQLWTLDLGPWPLYRPKI